MPSASKPSTNSIDEQIPPPALDFANRISQAIARATVYEHLLDFYASVAIAEHRRDGAEREATRTAGLLARAAVRIMQLPDLAALGKQEAWREADALYSVDSLDQLTELDSHVMLTRPAVRCPDGRVLYPCDAGMAAFRVTNATPLTRAPADFAEDDGDDAAVWDWDESVYDDDGLARSTWTPKTDLRAVLTSSMRRVLTRPDGHENGATHEAEHLSHNGRPPLYIARPAEHFIGIVPPDVVYDRGARIAGLQRALGRLTPAQLHHDALRLAMFEAEERCKKLEQVDCEEEYLNQEQNAIVNRENDPCPDDDPQVAAVTARRTALWNDSLRQAAISNDRLYAFVQQLTGTISEAVDAVAVIDESQLVEAERRAHDARRRAAERAAAVQLQVVRGVLGSVFRDSGLQLQFSENQIIKVSAGAVRQHATGSTRGH